ncbi:MAG: hypothetical protein LCH95_01000 [Proteobacteria bacterium]|nr:hypothetical protein [Pseudomonadota bacterium]MCA0300960.1 hypothetical protein [Pseudomonadota bacterium]
MSDPAVPSVTSAPLGDPHSALADAANALEKHIAATRLVVAEKTVELGRNAAAAAAHRASISGHLDRTLATQRGELAKLDRRLAALRSEAASHRRSMERVLTILHVRRLLLELLCFWLRHRLWILLIVIGSIALIAIYLFEPQIRAFIANVAGGATTGSGSP